jgi:phage tail tube protein FII
VPSGRQTDGFPYLDGEVQLLGNIARVLLDKTHVTRKRLLCCAEIGPLASRNEADELPADIFIRGQIDHKSH